MLRKIHSSAVAGLALVTAVVLSACGPGTVTQQATQTPQATAMATEASPMTTPEATPTTSASSGVLAAPGATVQMVNNPALGNILTDSDGMTLYTFKNDTPGASNCNGTCAQNWPPVTIAAGVQPSAGTGITGKLGVIPRPDGTYQVTYNDMPLYHFKGDAKPGDTNGQGVAGLWSVVSLSPAAPAAAPTEAQPMETPTPQAPSSY